MLHRHGSKQKNFENIAGKVVHDLAGLQLLSNDVQKSAVQSGHQGSNNMRDTSSQGMANKYSVPKKGLPADLSYQLIHNELTLDGNPHLNLASFVNTFTTDQARKLIDENLTKNLADNDEYPQLIELTQRCISMLAQLWHANPDEEPIGCATTGSSEAIMLGGLAMKKRWEHRLKNAGKDASKPNIIMSSACQVALEKFTRYFEVECRLVPVSHRSHHMLDPESLWDYVDENTIGCFVILGTTYTGHLENVEKVADVLSQIEAKHPDWSNTDIPIHADGASGGFIIPFGFEKEHMKAYGMERWGFNHPRVVSMNTSGHKFGLTTPGLGWVLWRDESLLADELRFKLKYLGGVEETFGLNFSRPGFQVVHQYFNFVSLGHSGYRTQFQNSLFVARAFSFELLNSSKLPGCFEIVSSIHESIENDSAPKSVKDYWEHPQAYKPGVPLVAFKLSKKFHEEYPEVPQAILSSLLRGRGWIIPNYPLPKATDGSDEKEVLRVVFRSEMKLDLAQLLIVDIESILTKLIHSYEKVCHHIELASEQTPERKSSFIYEMLLALASPQDDIPTPDEIEKKNKLKETTTRNYRGTC